MTPDIRIIMGKTIGRPGNDCYITTTVALLEMSDQYVLLVRYTVRGWCDDDAGVQIKWTGSDREEGLKQYYDFVNKLN